MSIEVEATYENGVLKLDRPLPIPEHQRVRVTVEAKSALVQESYGLLRWQGSTEDLDKLALDPEFGLEESP